MGSINFKKLESLLSTNGKTFYSLRKDKVVGTETIKKLQQGYGFIDTRTIANLCEYLDCQPGDLMEYVPDTTKQDPAADQAKEPADAKDPSGSNPHRYETLDEKLERLHKAHTSQKE